MQCTTRVITSLAAQCTLWHLTLPAAEPDQSQAGQLAILFRLAQMKKLIQESVDAFGQRGPR